LIIEVIRVDSDDMELEFALFDSAVEWAKMIGLTKQRSTWI
jgi:hypothetical protein